MPAVGGLPLTGMPAYRFFEIRGVTPPGCGFAGHIYLHVTDYRAGRS